MFRGYLGGAFVGLATSAVGLGALSLTAPQPAGSAPPQTPAVESPDLAGATSGSDVDEIVPEVTADAGGAPAPSDTPEVGVEGTTVPEVQTDTMPLQQPDAGEVTAGLAVPSTADDPVVTAGAEEPVLPNPQIAAPAVPDSEEDVTLDTSPALPAIPGVDETEDAATEAAAVEELVVEEPIVEDVAEAVEPVAPTAEEVAEAEAVVPADEGSISDTPTLVAPDVDGTLPVTPGTDDEDTSLIALQGEESTLPGDGAVRIIDPEAETAEDAAQEDAPTETVVPDNGLAAFAAAFENVESKPLMSVILIDDGSLAGSEQALAQMSVPVTVAIDPASSGAAERMAAFRAAGFEVMALAEVPAGALPTDAAVTLEAGFATLSETIGLLDIGQAGLQTDRDVAQLAMSRLSEAGLGFVTLGQGLNTGLRAADEADVMAVSVYRDIDADNQDARIIRRFLDQAAFRARQQGTVVLVGRVRADTISALTLWGTSNQDGPVAMAPVSAVLMAQ